MTDAGFPGKAAPAPGDETGAAGTEERAEHGYAENGTDRAKIHYAVLGEGPLVVMLHGFPDYWYTWRYHMAALSEDYRVAAPDLRGYNLSEKPEGVESYDMRLLVGDVRAVISALGHDKPPLSATTGPGPQPGSLRCTSPKRPRS